MTALAIVTRPSWGANPVVTPAGHIATPTAELWLHHTASTGLHGAAGMRSLQAGALAGGYVDLEYSYVVDNPTGEVFESRGPGRNTAATGGGHNEISHALCVMGNFEVELPAEAVLDSLAQLVAWGHGRGYWPAQITGPHRDASGNATACCGRYLIEHIDEINRRALGADPGAGGPITGGDDVPADKDYVDALTTDEGAWKLQYDGGVSTIRGPFYGSYFSLPASVRNDPTRRFRSICGPISGGSKGYTLVSTRGEEYEMVTRQ